MIWSPLCPVVQPLLASTGKILHAVEAVRRSYSVWSSQGESYHCLGPCLKPSCQWACWVLLPTALSLTHPRWASIRWHLWPRETRFSFWNWGQNSVPPISSSAAFVCDYLPTIGFERGRLGLGRTQCLLNLIVHSPDVPCYGGCLYPGWALSNTRSHIASWFVEPCSWYFWESAASFRWVTVCAQSGRYALPRRRVSIRLTSHQINREYLRYFSWR